MAGGGRREGAGRKKGVPNKLTQAMSAKILEAAHEGAQRAEVTVESLLKEAGDIQQKALEKEQFGPAVAALTAKAKLAGHWVEKREDVASRRTSEQIYARLSQIIAAGNADRGGGPDRGAGPQSSDDEAVPTVPGHGTA